VDRVSELFENHHESLYRYLVRLSGEPDIAADAAQEAFVRLLERPPKGPVERAWLFKVGTNCVLEGLRTAARRERLLDGRADQTMADPPRDPAEVLEAEERRQAVMAALAQLNDKERIAVLMREEGFSHREIAEAVGTTTGSVGTLLARTLERLAREITFGREVL
jgi:RNA polymerase sigma-70 factor (ECF subfamily)